MSARARQLDAPPEAVTGPEPAGRVPIALALLAVYVIWGSTYLAIRVAVESFPPFLMAGIRFVVPGAILIAAMHLRGIPLPTARQWIGSGAVGFLLLVAGNGGVTYAEQSVASGITATIIGSVPLWALLFTWLRGHRPGRAEWIGLLLGFAGLVVLNTGSELRATPVGAMVLVGAAMCWALGSVWSGSLSLPDGLMGSGASMLAAGIMLLGIGLVAHEHLPAHPSAQSVWAVLYLITFGSIVAFSAYRFLLQHTRPALATSYGYVNPLVAVALGVAVLGERVSGRMLVALVVIVSGVVLVMVGRKPGI